MIIIVGAGIAGLSLAFELVQRGAGVTVLEAGKVASGASGVATSYLEPRLGNTAMRKIEWDALKRWDNYANSLQELSGIDIAYRKEGQLRVSLEEHLPKLNNYLSGMGAQNWEYTSLTPAELQAIEPALSPQIIAGAHIHDVRWVTGEYVCNALCAAIRTAGGTVVENSPVVETKIEVNGVSVTLGDGTKHHGDRLILCNGAGANELPCLPNDIPHSQVVRGVNLLLDMAGLKQPLRHLIKHHNGNLCPRSYPDTPAA